MFFSLCGSRTELHPVCHKHRQHRSEWSGTHRTVCLTSAKRVHTGHEQSVEGVDAGRHHSAQRDRHCHSCGARVCTTLRLPLWSPACPAPEHISRYGAEYINMLCHGSLFNFLCHHIALYGPYRSNFTEVIVHIKITVQQGKLWKLPGFCSLCSLDSGLRKERRRKKKITNIISFDDDLDAGAEDDDEGNGRVRSLRKNTSGDVNSEDALEACESSPSQNGLPEPEHGIISWAETPPQNGVPLDTKSTDPEEDEDEDFYGKNQPSLQEDHGSGEQCVHALLLCCFFSPSPPHKLINNDYRSCS